MYTIKSDVDKPIGQVTSENNGTSMMVRNDSSEEKDVLKCVKVYIPAEGYDSKLTFEQNLSEGKVQLFSETPACEFDGDDPIKECLSFSLLQKCPSDFDKLLSSNSNTSSFLNPSAPSTVNKNQPKQHICDVCAQNFRHRRDLALHYLTHSEKEKRKAAKSIKKCDVCEKDLRQCRCKSILEKIYPTFKHMPNSFSLPQPINSSVVFVKAESISGKSNVIKRELFHCPECELPFGLESQLKQHILFHKRERAKKEQTLSNCSICHQNFKDKESLACHLSTIHSIKLDSVSNQFNQESLNVLPLDFQVQVCTSCHTIFNNFDGLERHLKRLGWVCIFCNMYFCLKSDFHTHYLTHMKESSINTKLNSYNSSTPNHVADISLKFNSCHICNKKFKFLSLLKQHLIQHHNKQYHCCQFCGKKFKRKISAHIHFLTHNRKANVCLICNKMFFVKRCLETHVKSHTK